MEEIEKDGAVEVIVRVDCRGAWRGIGGKSQKSKGTDHIYDTHHGLLGAVCRLMIKSG